MRTTFHYAVDLRIQTYAELNPLKYGKLATNVRGYTDILQRTGANCSARFTCTAGRVCTPRLLPLLLLLLLMVVLALLRSLISCSAR